MNEIIAGGLAGGSASLITSPLELIKTRIQSQSSQLHQLQSSKTNIFKFSIKCFKNIIQKEGISSLWKGATPTVIGSIPSRAIFFGIYDQIKTKLSKQQYSDTITNLTSSFIGGIVSTTLTSPIWMVKTRMQLNEHKGVTSPLSICKSIVRQEGMKGFWKGIGASWLGVFETCTQWMLLEHLKHKIGKDTPCYNFAYASIAKLIATTIWYPHEVLRTRLREKNNPYKNTLHCLQQIVRSESVFALYTGLNIQLIRTVPNFAITIYIYNFLFKIINQ